MKKVLYAIIGCVFLVTSAFAQKTTTSSQASTNKKGTINLTKEEFIKKIIDYENNPKEWIYLGDKPCIVDFYASWCGPCKQIAPILEELAATYNGRIYIYKVNIDKEKELAQAFGIQSIPTLILSPVKGNPTMIKGLQTKESLISLIDNQLLAKAVKKKQKK